MKTCAQIDLPKRVIAGNKTRKIAIISKKVAVKLISGLDIAKKINGVSIRTTKG